MPPKSILRGMSAPLLTPYLDDGNVNYEEYERLTKFVTDAGVRGIFVGGTSGEFVNLTIDERKKLLTAALKGAKSASSVMFNATAMNLKDMKDLFDWAKSEGAQAASVTAPYYHRYDEKALVSYFKKVSELSGDLPLYLYNMPGMTNNKITPYVLQAVSDGCSNVRGLKDSSMDFLNFQEYQILDLPENFELITGNDAQVLPVLQSGGAGGVIAMADVYPELCQSIWDNFMNGDLKSAQIAQTKVLKLRDLVRSIMPIMSHKKMLELQGFHMGPARFPFRELTAEECELIKEGIQSAFN